MEEHQNEIRSRKRLKELEQEGRTSKEENRLQVQDQTDLTHRRKREVKVVGKRLRSTSGKSERLAVVSERGVELVVVVGNPSLDLPLDLSPLPHCLLHSSFSIHSQLLLLLQFHQFHLFSILPHQ